MSITKSKRNKFIAGHVEPGVKEELQDVAKRQKKSVSKFISEAIEEKLEKETSPDTDAE